MTLATDLTTARLTARLRATVMTPISAMRWAYLPLLMVYFAYGALGLTAVAESFWIKKALTLSATELSSLAVWLGMPWAAKMVFGELVDTVAIRGSQRRAYIFIGAGLIALAFLLLAATSGGWITFIKADRLYVIASLVSVIGVVLQDVVADTMTTEVVATTAADGTARPRAEIEHDLAMVQILGRLAASLATVLVAGLSGWLAAVLEPSTIYLLGLVVPLISVSGALLVRLVPQERRPIDWTILGGGLALAAFVTAIGIADVPGSQEITFVVSMAVVITMLARVTTSIDPATRQRIGYAALIIFMFRAYPHIGEGYRWFTIDVLGFDETFYGWLQQVGAIVTLVVAWVLSDAITRYRMTTVLLAFTLIGFVLNLPGILLVYGGHAWTARVLGVGAKSIAIIDTAAASPLDALGMVPLLTLVALYAPARQRATWFALMTSFMNLALVAGELMTKYLNMIFVVERGNYKNLPALTVVVTALALIMPLAAIIGLRRRVD